MLINFTGGNAASVVFPQIQKLSGKLFYYQKMYGPNKRIELTAISGNALSAVEDYGRDDFQIHGGRSQATLWNTNGCIRVFDKDIKKITEFIEDSCGGGTGTVEIVES